MDKNDLPGRIFNSTIAAFALVAANEIGLLKKLNEAGSVSFSQFCSSEHIQQQALRQVLANLMHENILLLNEDEITKGKNFDVFFTNKGYFSWLLKGYSYALQNMDVLLKGQDLKVSNINRDSAAIAQAGKDYGANFVDPYFNKLLSEVKPKFVADLGCGSGERLINIVRSNENIKGIGFDISPAAVEVARQNVALAGLQNSIEIICQDVGAFDLVAPFAQVDTLVSFFMGHDLWPKERCFNIFIKLSRIFPKATNFLLCDTYRSDENANAVFTRGFELVHAFMGQEVPTYGDWINLFNDLQWDLQSVTNIAINNSSIFQLKIQKTPNE